MTSWPTPGGRGAELRRAREAVEATRAQASDTLAELRAMRAGIEEERRRFEREREATRDARAKANRSGDNGPDLRRVQERVDLRQTTWDAVWRGEDQHASAVRVRHQATRNLTELGDRLEAADQRGSEQSRARAGALRQAEENARAMRSED